MKKGPTLIPDSVSTEDVEYKMSDCGNIFLLLSVDLDVRSVSTDVLFTAIEFGDSRIILPQGILAMSKYSGRYEH